MVHGRYTALRGLFWFVVFERGAIESRKDGPTHDVAGRHTAIAQTAGSRNPAAHRSTNSGQQLLPGDAPVGHRQPRADQVPSEKNPAPQAVLFVRSWLPPSTRYGVDGKASERGARL